MRLKGVIDNNLSTKTIRSTLRIQISNEEKTETRHESPATVHHPRGQVRREVRRVKKSRQRFRLFSFINFLLLLVILSTSSTSSWILLPPPSPFYRLLGRDRLVKGIILGVLLSNRPRIGIFPQQAIQQGLVPGAGGGCLLQQQPVAAAPLII